jgi:hypothetical protein
MDIKQYINPIKINLDTSNGKELVGKTNKLNTILEDKTTNDPSDDKASDICLCACLSYLCILIFRGLE